ncbi:unnamed protein product [Macrosiphum euphorbiae]|uniref:Uncharacterized protein n=1 Tax=Macrosiphum euphorbiae TaxID=13131 RepID=A0AAV0XRD6_9HEMI|nr:unnamed protein product [Macrosiphum euphorbiae]
MKKFENFLKLHKILPKVTLPINKELLVTTCKSLIEILEDTLVNVGIEENNIETDDSTDSTLFEPDYNISLYKFKDNIMNDYFENLEIERTSMMLHLNVNVDNFIDNIFDIENTENVPWTLNEDITRPHGILCIAEETMILVPQEVKTIFQLYFPKVELFAKNTKQCRRCKAYYKNVFNPRMINFMSGAVQNKYLFPLVCDNLRPYHTVENVLYFCIPKDLIKSWQTFVANSREKLKPIMINNKSLLYQDHNELLFEPTSNFVASEHSVSVIITKEKW